ncbi:MAG: Mov34/MPN/PAD-1 family protein [Candidatus Altiarchaeota archaeon]
MMCARIKSNALEFILGVSRSLHPREFTGQLRGEGDLITETLVIPASTFGNGFATTRFDMIPLDKSIIGSIHSHPSNTYRPSEADFRYFERGGSIHLIVRYPYNGLGDVAAYTSSGERISLEVDDEN